MSGKQLVTVSELAEQLQLKERHIYTLAERGDIPCLKAGALLRFNLDEVVEALRQPAKRKRR